MKKIIAKIKRSFQKAASILAGLSDSRPELRPIPVPVERGFRIR
ncbi:MAG: hypothetical protein NTW32_08115 [Chloroflexi bacterium]|nr:hypothetical protein [Chloroflexota bacterium]